MQRLLPVRGRFGVTSGYGQASQMAAPYHFLVVDDENAGFVVHGTTS
jgi:hypothetical protein